MSNSFSIANIIGLGWERFKRHWKMYYGMVGAMVLLSWVSQWIIGDVMKEGGMLAVVLWIANMVVQFMIGIGWLRALIKMGRDESPDWSELWSGWPYLLNYFLTVLLEMVLIVLGLVLFIVPGIYLALRFAFAPYLVVDKGLGPIAALKKSGEMTKGIKLQMIGFGLALLLLNLGGLLLLVVGLVITTPISALANASLYNHLVKGVSGLTTKAVSMSAKNAKAKKK